MKYEKLYLKNIVKSKVGENATLETYLCNDMPEVNLTLRPAMIVVPGGGYQMCSDREAEPIALRFMSEGFNCFVIKYTCNTSYPQPHLELASVINHINKNSKKFHLIPNCISLVGFSAGGHLVSSYSYLYKELAKEIKVDPKDIKPFSIILGYPVTYTKVPTTSQTAAIITANKQKLIDKLNVQDHITSNYPPTFIFTTKVDQCVPYIHSTSLVKLLKKNNVKHEFVLYKKGIHGGSLFNNAVYPKDMDKKHIEPNKDWTIKAANFIYSLIK